MKCIPQNLFVKDDYLANLVCPIGYGVFRDPVALPCQHVFCRPCIESSNDSKGCGTCPICFDPWSKEQLKSQIEVAELINQSVATCPQCSWTGQYQVLEKHSKNNCQNTLVTCQYGCGASAPRKFIAEHEATCRSKKVECKSCKKIFSEKEFSEHETFCPEKEMDCPVCASRIKLFEIDIHTKTIHPENPVCMFSFAGCYFVPKAEATLEMHYKEAMDKHLDMLCTTVAVLEDKLEKIEKGAQPDKELAMPSPAAKQYQALPKVYPIKWSTGSNQIAGSKKGGWSFFLSNAAVSGNFVVKLRILALANDPNTWKMCLGLFNSQKSQAGSWDKYRNGWGYILGNGNKIHESPATTYGMSYGIGDNVWIEHKNGKISFYKNGISPGVAFSGITGPFYVAAALSDSGHVIDLIEVTELWN